MKEKVIAVIIFVSVILFVGVNTCVINKQMKEIGQDVRSLDTDSDDACEIADNIFGDFLKKEKYLSLTVSHEDLTNIENCFVEMRGYISIGDTDNAKVVKDRLEHYIEHLRRLSTFTIEAII